MKLTLERLKKSDEFNKWVNGRVSLIHEFYTNEPESASAFLVIHSDMGKYTLTRFWHSLNRKDQLEKIHVSQDSVNVAGDDVFRLLLSQYSNPLT